MRLSYVFNRVCNFQAIPGEIYPIFLNDNCNLLNKLVPFHMTVAVELNLY